MCVLYRIVCADGFYGALVGTYTLDLLEMFVASNTCELCTCFGEHRIFLYAYAYGVLGWNEINHCSYGKHCLY